MIYFKHALMTALIPVITVVGLQIGSLIAFAIVTETVFQWPGMGFLFIQAVNFGDVPGHCGLSGADGIDLRRDKFM